MKGNVEGTVEPAAGGVATLEPVRPTALPTAARRSRRPLVVGLIAAAIVLVLASIAVIGNNALSQTYSPRRSVQDYFAAQRRGDVQAMWAGATYKPGQGGYTQFFDHTALAAMMAVPENRDVRDVRIQSISPVDSNTVSVSVALTWHGAPHSLTLTARKDPSNVHFLFYPSWRVEIPSTTLQLTLPNQPGPIFVDTVENPVGASATNIAAIMGFHQVQMGATSLYAATTQTVDAVQSASVTLKGTLSPTTIAAANAAVKDNLSNSCNVSKYDDCPGHQYAAPDQNYIYYFTVPGHGNVNYSRYVFTLTGDPTAGMTMTVSADPGKIAVSGSCTTTLTVNGSARYNLKGTFSGTLTWNNGGFDSDLNVFCDQSAA